MYIHLKAIATFLLSCCGSWIFFKSLQTIKTFPYVSIGYRQKHSPQKNVYKYETQYWEPKMPSKLST